MIYELKRNLKLSERKKIKSELNKPTIFGVVIPFIVDSKEYLGNLSINKNLGTRLSLYNKDTEEIYYKDLINLFGTHTIECGTDILTITIN